MLGKAVKLFSLFGFEVKLDFSWLIIAVLIVWSLATGLFPVYYADLTTAEYWWMGIAGAIGLFISIVIHEFSHSIVARKYGIPMKGITLFIFGGVAEMSEEPGDPKSEMLMALAGPAASIILAGIFYGLHLFAVINNWTEPITGVLMYLALINIIVVVFNLLPAFPLDGGRVLRAALWSWKHNLRWATRISANIGSGFGVALIVLGAITFIGGNFISGVWFFLIGMFLRSVSQGSYQQLLVRKALEGESLRRFMRRDPVTVSPDITLQQLVDDYIYRYNYKIFPVTSNSQPVRCIHIQQVKDVPKEQWSNRTVNDVARQCSPENSISADTDAVEALSTMRQTGNSRFLVMDKNKLEGVITLRDMLDFLSLKIDLEEAR